jgi:valine--pyruvate aminotransferase
MLSSRISRKLEENNGILSLMSDLSEAWVSQGDKQAFLGGGNPARILPAEAIFESAFQSIAQNSETARALLGDYSGPIGNRDIRELTAQYLSPLLRADLNWENIGFFNGSQNAFSFLLNAFSGTMEDGSFKKITLPIVPEYIGYADQTWEENVFEANLPEMETLSPYRFKYKVNRDSLNLENSGCIAISRPTNPTGNVISASELNFLYDEARNRDIPLLVDLAYGNPFPNLIGAHEPITFRPGMVLSLSFSKIGLPGVRFGIIVSDAPIIRTLSAFGAVANLSSGNLGAELARFFWKNNTLIDLSNNILRPYYESKKIEALEIIEGALQSRDVSYSIHAPDGGFFLWIYFPTLKITNRELYQLCKVENLYIVSGHYFFPGLSVDFSHVGKCIRLTYCRAQKEIVLGAEILAKLVSQNCA